MRRSTPAAMTRKVPPVRTPGSGKPAPDGGADEAVGPPGGAVVEELADRTRPHERRILGAPVVYQ